MRLLLIAIVLAFNIPAYAATLIVPDDYVTIKSAVDAADEGDTVLVRAGTYSGFVDIRNKNISLKSISGASSTIINAQGDIAAVGLYGLDSSTILDGFTLTNGLRGIYIGGGSPTIKNCIIVNNGDFNNENHSTGIWAGVAGIIENCIIKNNIGSGITIGGGYPTIKDCEITNNGSLTLGGGGIFLAISRPNPTEIPVKIENSTISNNCAGLTKNHCVGGDGENIYAWNRSLEIINSNINTLASNWGSGIFMENGSLNIVGSTISDHEGNGLKLVYLTSVNISNSTIARNGNRYTGGGGGIFIWESGLIKINSSTISNNVVFGRGGNYGMGAGISLYATELELSGSVIRNNIASGLEGGHGYGGGIHSEGRANLKIINSIIEGNQADYGAGIVSHHGGSTNISVINSTITGNTANIEDGAMQTSGSEDFEVINSILYNNPPNEISGNPIISYSNIKGGYEGEGNIDADPLFVSAASSNFHLRAGSPCIDTGTNMASEIPEKDFEGNPRIIDGDKDGFVIVDMGAYEYVSVTNLAEIIGTWSSGIWYWDFVASIWTQMTVSAPTGDIAAGDFTGDGKADVASIWGNGLWYQDGDTLDWTKVSNTAPTQVTVGDVSGDGRSEIIGTWSNGIWYWDVAASDWTRMSSSNPTGDIAAGDFTGDGKADVASIWGNGLWYQDGDTLDWTKVSNTAPTQVTVGDVSGDGRSEIIGTWSNGIWYWDVAASDWTRMSSSTPPGDIAAGDFTSDGKADVASCWNNGLWYQDGDTLDWTKVSNTAPTQVTVGDVTGD